MVELGLPWGELFFKQGQEREASGEQYISSPPVLGTGSDRALWALGHKKCCLVDSSGDKAQYRGRVWGMFYILCISPAQRQHWWLFKDFAGLRLCKIEHWWAAYMWRCLKQWQYQAPTSSSFAGSQGGTLKASMNILRNSQLTQEVKNQRNEVHEYVGSRQYASCQI